MSDPIVHEYTPLDDTERAKLEELAKARCKVKPRINESQPHTNWITVAFYKDKTIPLAVVEILDPSGQTQDLIELKAPMQELELKSLAEIWEVSAPRVPTALSKSDLATRCQSYNCRLETNQGNSLVSIWNQWTSDVTIVMTDGKNIQILAGDYEWNIPSTKIADITY